MAAHGMKNQNLHWPKNKMESLHLSIADRVPTPFGIEEIADTKVVSNIFCQISVIIQAVAQRRCEKSARKIDLLVQKE